MNLNQRRLADFKNRTNRSQGCVVDKIEFGADMTLFASLIKRHSGLWGHYQKTTMKQGESAHSRQDPVLRIPGLLRPDERPSC